MSLVTSSMVGAGLKIQQLVCRTAWQRPILLGCVFSGHVVRHCAAESLLSLAAGGCNLHRREHNSREVMRSSLCTSSIPTSLKIPLKFDWIVIDDGDLQRGRGMESENSR